MENSTELFQEGVQAFEKKDYDRAEKCFVALLKKNKNYADVYNRMGVIYHSRGEFTPAIESFEKAIKINPNYTEALLNLTVLYNDLGQYKKASSLYKRVFPTTSRRKKEKMDPFIKNKIANKHAELGDTYAGIGLHPEAIVQYETALNLRSQFLDIKLKWALSLREEGKHAQAIKILSQILKSNTRFHQARVQLGVTYFAQGQKKKAVEAWKAVLKAHPSDESAKMYLRLADEPKTPAAPKIKKKK